MIRGQEFRKALFEKVITKTELQRNTLKIKVEDEWKRDNSIEISTKMFQGYESNQFH